MEECTQIFQTSKLFICLCLNYKEIKKLKIQNITIN